MDGVNRSASITRKFDVSVEVCVSCVALMFTNPVELSAGVLHVNAVDVMTLMLVQAALPTVMVMVESK